MNAVVGELIGKIYSGRLVEKIRLLSINRPLFSLCSSILKIGILKVVYEHLEDELEDKEEEEALCRYVL